MSQPPPIDRRGRRMLFLFLCQAIIVALFIARSAQLAAQSRNIPSDLNATKLLAGVRGAILAPDGTPLAWSTRSISLVWEVPPELEAACDSWEIGAAIDVLYGMMPPREELPKLLGTRWILFHDATDYPAALEVMALLNQPEYHAVGHTIRCTLARPGQREILGETVVDSTGVEKGISGLELQYDAILRAGLTPIVVSVDSGSVLRLPDGFFTRPLNGQNFQLAPQEWPYEIPETAIDEEAAP